MIGGLYCEIPMGKFYNGVVTKSVQKRMRTLLGVRPPWLDSEFLDNMIVDELYKETDSYFTQRRAKGYRDITNNLARSYGFAIYHNGELIKSKLKEFGAPPQRRKDGIHGPSEFTVFVNNYRPQNPYFVVLLTAAAPYAADVEIKYHKNVLIQMVNGISQRLWTKFRRTGHIEYGYRFSDMIVLR